MTALPPPAPRMVISAWYRSSGVPWQSTVSWNGMPACKHQITNDDVRSGSKFVLGSSFHCTRYAEHLLSHLPVPRGMYCESVVHSLILLRLTSVPAECGIEVLEGIWRQRGRPARPA